MHGTVEVPFSELFKDTMLAHGMEWSWKYYGKRGMEFWEFAFWVKATGTDPRIGRV